MIARETSPGQTEQVAAVVLGVRSLPSEAQDRMLWEGQERVGAPGTDGPGDPG